MRPFSFFEEMKRLEKQMNNLFEGIYNEDPFRNDFVLEDFTSNGKELAKNNYKQPISDIYESEKEIIAEIEIPGVNKEDIKINLSDNKIEIKAENKSEFKKEDKKKGVYRFERNYSGFYRNISLPKNVDIDKAEADYKDGILKIKVPKLELEESKKRFLKIN